MKNKNFLNIVLFLFVLLIVNIFVMSLIKAETHPASVEKISGSLGEINPETGQPKTITNIKEKIDEYREQDVSYLKKEWTKILANNKFFGPFLFYTDKGFSFFNPLWKYSFGIEFSWSLAFFFHIFLWIVIICVIFFPAKEIFQNSLFALITGIVVASITGAFGIITEFVNILDVIFNKLWKLTAFVIIIISLIVIYGKLFKGFQVESEEEELKRSKEAIKSHGEVSKKGLE